MLNKTEDLKKLIEKLAKNRVLSNIETNTAIAIAKQSQGEIVPIPLGKEVINDKKPKTPIK